MKVFSKKDIVSVSAIVAGKGTGEEKARLRITDEHPKKVWKIAGNDSISALLSAVGLFLMWQFADGSKPAKAVATINRLVSWCGFREPDRRHPIGLGPRRRWSYRRSGGIPGRGNKSSPPRKKYRTFVFGPGLRSILRDNGRGCQTSRGWSQLEPGQSKKYIGHSMPGKLARGTQLEQHRGRLPPGWNKQCKKARQHSELECWNNELMHEVIIQDDNTFGTQHGW